MLIAVLLIAFLAVAGRSFWLGTYYEAQSGINRMRQFYGGGNQGQLRGMPGGQQQGSMGVTGKVDEVTSDTITMTTRFGSQKITFSSKTAVNKPSPGSIDDIKQGTEILVQGERDSEGKIQAKTIQIISR
jgi:hypothetical protein